jgi:hypothetical protein
MLADPQSKVLSRMEDSMRKIKFLQPRPVPGQRRAKDTRKKKVLRVISLLLLWQMVIIPSAFAYGVLYEAEAASYTDPPYAVMTAGDINLIEVMPGRPFTTAYANAYKTLQHNSFWIDSFVNEGKKYGGLAEALEMIQAVMAYVANVAYRTDGRYDASDVRQLKEIERKLVPEYPELAEYASNGREAVLYKEVEIMHRIALEVMKEASEGQAVPRMTKTNTPSDRVREFVHDQDQGLERFTATVDVAQRNTQFDGLYNGYQEQVSTFMRLSVDDASPKDCDVLADLGEDLQKVVANFISVLDEMIQADRAALSGYRSKASSTEDRQYKDRLDVLVLATQSRIDSYAKIKQAWIPRTRELTGRIATLREYREDLETYHRNNGGRGA